LKFTFIFALCLCFTAQGEEITLGLNWKAEPQFGGFYAAESIGAFKKRGLQVKIIEGGAGTPTIQMLAAGKLRFGIVSADEIILNHANGGDVVALFATYQTNPQAIMVHPNRGFKSLQDVFKSKGVIALQRGLPYALYLQKKFAPLEANLVPYLGGIANFLHDPKYSQQCFFTSEPLAAEKAGHPVQTFLVSASGFNPYTTVLATRMSEIANHPEVVKNMVKAVQSGWQAYLQNPAEVNQLMHKLNPSMSIETFRASADRQKPLIENNRLGTMTEERWKTLISQMRDLGLVKNQIDAAVLFRNY
jgi:NitT/TauT family transport system substrate-binding protein